VRGAGGARSYAPGGVFNVPAGVTVNSAEGGIIDNSLVPDGNTYFDTSLPSATTNDGLQFQFSDPHTVTFQ
jgi:hypothetical protein